MRPSTPEDESVKFATNLIAFAFLWALMTEARLDAWLVGGPVVVAAAVAAVLLASSPGWRWSAIGFVRFAPHFARNSFLGGLDVAWRSMHPRLPIDPRLIEYNLRLPVGAARVFFMNVINLLPGTLSADTRDDVLLVHVIDGTRPMQQQLADLEFVVARLFATRLGASETKEQGTL